METSFEHLDLVDDETVVAFKFERSAERQLVREQQPNSKQSLIESHDSGFSFERSPNQTPSQTKFGRPNPPANEATLSDQLYKTKTIKKRSHPSRNIRRQFKLDSLNCSFDDSLDLHTISSVDSSRLESATENSNSFELEDEHLRIASDLNKAQDVQHDPIASERHDEHLKKTGSARDSRSSRRSDKKASGYLISKEEFKKRISSESVNLPDYPLKDQQSKDSQSNDSPNDRFEETGKKRNKSRNSKKLNKQTSSTTSIPTKGKNQPFKDYPKSASATSLNDEQIIAKPHTTTRTISSLKNQMLDIVNWSPAVGQSSISRSGHPSPDERLSDRSSGKSSGKYSDNQVDKSNDRASKKAGDKQAIKFPHNQRNWAENTSTVTTKSVSSFKKAYLRTAVAWENGSVFNKKRNNHRHHYNG